MKVIAITHHVSHKHANTIACSVKQQNFEVVPKRRRKYPKLPGAADYRLVPDQVHLTVSEPRNKAEVFYLPPQANPELSTRNPFLLCNLQ